jgi:hypothetical protein
MKLFFFTYFIIFQLCSFAQNSSKNNNFNYKVTEILGDLNKDDLLDKVIITQDTSSENAPYKFEIFFKESNGKFTLIVSSTKIIEPQYPNGKNGYMTGTGFSDIKIKNGVLSINVQLLRGYFEHKFRFQNGNFELIGFSKVYSDGHTEMETIDFNLSTGIRIEKSESLDTNKLLSNQKKKILISPLPKLQDIVPFENELY